MTLRKVLLTCGVLSSLLYVGIDLLAAIRYGEYHSFVSGTISELGARGAPTKQLVDPLLILYDVITIAFGVGVWSSAGGKSALRMVGVVIIAIGVVGLLGHGCSLCTCVVRRTRARTFRTSSPPV